MESVLSTLSSRDHYGNIVKEENYPFTHLDEKDYSVKVSVKIENSEDSLDEAQYNSPLHNDYATCFSTNVKSEPSSCAEDQILPKIKLGTLNPTDYKCKFCTFKAVLKKMLKDHIKTEHTDQMKYFSCDLCDGLFSTARNLKKHKIVIHQTEFFQCNDCNFKTRYKKNLQVHVTYHTGELSQLCYICGFRNSDKKNMTLHINRHNGVKTVLCNICNYKCVSKSSLSKHMDVHLTERLYSCNNCPARFKTVHYLNKHKEIHVDIKPFKCSICTHAFRTKMILDKHLMLHSTNRKRFYCEQCGKDFLNKRNMLRHELTHSYIKLHCCTYCKATFVAKLGLDNHIKRHTGEGKMYCLECSYSSIHRANFIEHVNRTCKEARHADEKKMHCLRCNFSSSHRSNFVNHVNKGCSYLKGKTVQNKLKYKK